MRPNIAIVLALLLGVAATPARAQEGDDAQTPSTFRDAVAQWEERLEQAVAELDRLMSEISEEKIPLTRELRELESELVDVRAELRDASRELDEHTFALGQLRPQIEARREEASYVSNQIAEYVRNLESRLHIAELQRYEDRIEAAKSAPEDDELSTREVQAVQTGVLHLSLDRLEEALGGTRFEGSAVDPGGLVSHGQIALLGPLALFRSDDGAVVGTAEQRLGSLEPTVFELSDPADARAAAELVRTGEGRLPLDPTLGNAHKIEATEDTLWEHVRKGGLVMIPIGALAGLALLVALYKWIALTFTRKPSRKKVRALLDAVEAGDEAAAREHVGRIEGPVGRMLRVGVDHIREPRQLVEEVMYETVLTTRLEVQRFLPFVAICAASAPLLGLLGTVTGIIKTFERITVFGSGDVKSLSGGISEALITTKFGLIVAIPSLLLHAFLWRKARGVTGRMEATAISFVNHVEKARFERLGGSDPDDPDDASEPGPAAAAGVPSAAAPADPPASLAATPDPPRAPGEGSPVGLVPGATARAHAPATSAAHAPVGAPAPGASTAVDPDLVRAQVKEILGDLLVPRIRHDADEPGGPA